MAYATFCLDDLMDGMTFNVRVDAHKHNSTKNTREFLWPYVRNNDDDDDKTFDHYHHHQHPHYPHIIIINSSCLSINIIEISNISCF